jgi:hypothetical protein
MRTGQFFRYHQLQVASAVARASCDTGPLRNVGSTQNGQADILTTALQSEPP